MLHKILFGNMLMSEGYKTKVPVNKTTEVLDFFVVCPGVQTTRR